MIKIICSSRWEWARRGARAARAPLLAPVLASHDVRKDIRTWAVTLI